VRLSVRTASPLLLGAIAALASACGGAEAEAPRREAPAARQDAIAVTTAAIVARDVPLIIRATGTFAADESSDVTPHVSGSVVATPVSVGDRVRAGTLIVRLDDRSARLELAQAQATLQQVEAQAQNARAEVSRHAELVQSGDISRSAYEKLTTQVATAEAAVAQARAREALAQKAVVDTNVLAPFGGYVSERPVAVGEYVTPASKVVTIVRIQPIKLALQVSESHAARLVTGMQVRAEVPAHPGVVFSGTITARNPTIDPGSRAMTVEARFANADGRLTPGMFGTAEIALPTTEAAFFVPRAAVSAIANGESSIVYVVEGDRVRVRVVQLGEEADGMARVLSGVEGEALVATSHLPQLFDGATVQLATRDPAGTAGGSR